MTRLLTAIFLLLCGVQHAAMGGDLLEALKEAIKTQVPGSEFLTILEHSPELAVAAVEIKIGTLRNEVSLDDHLSQEEKDRRLSNLEDAASRMTEVKAGQNHPDQAKDPFIGRFTSPTPIGPSIPSEVSLKLGAGAATASIVKPQIWGGGIAHPDVLEGAIKATLGATGFTLTEHTFKMGSFDIHGTPSGINTVVLKPDSATDFSFNPTTGEFEAHYEGLIVNNLYPTTNPIVFLSDTTGIIQSDKVNVVQTTQDAWIVPGVPGAPPLDSAGMAYIGTRAGFDASTQKLTFSDNVNTLANPDVTIVREPNGTYVSVRGSGESLVGATFQLDPLTYLGRDIGGRYLFSNANFRFTSADGLLAQGLLQNVGIDPTTYLFTGDAVLDDIPGTTSSALLASLMGPRGQFQLLGSEATLDLLAATNEFATSAMSPSDYVNFHPIPELPSNRLIAIGSVLLLGAWSQRRTRPVAGIRDQEPVGRHRTRRPQ